MYNIRCRWLAVVLVWAGVVVAAGDDNGLTAVTGTSDAGAHSVQMQDPIKMLQGVTANVLAALEKNKNVVHKNIELLVDQYILPHVDFNEMAQWVAGRAVWAKASEQSRQRFVSVFKVLVVRTYASALDSYSNEKIKFIDQKIDTTKDRIQISSIIERPNREKIKVDYRLVRSKDQWYVYDVIIEGVSILQGFQAQFSDEIRQRGLEPVIVQIQEHNKKNDV